MSQIPSVLAFLASILGTGTALAPSVFDVAPDTAGQRSVQGIPGQLSPRVDRSGTVTVRREDDGLFYLEGRVNGVPVRFLLDSGANMVILPGDLAAAAGLPAGPAARARTVGGGARFALSRARRIEAAGWTLPNVPVAVAPDSTAPAILGMNALARMGRITVIRNEMVFEGAPAPAGRQAATITLR